jgi:alpha-beta hydrolase superfamily lysophospholipase
MILRSPAYGTTPVARPGDAHAEMMQTTTDSTWSPDTALDGFEATTFELPPDDEGPVVATLVRRRAHAPSGRAVLYIHGFNDYFFQAHLADAYNAHGYDFYALDLRKYGRSLRPGQTPNFCRDLREYYPEIDAAIDVITGADGHGWLLLNGHSTGALTAALYAHEGPRRSRISALFLNSPFFGLNITPREQALAGVSYRVGARLPKLRIPGSLSALYGESCHRSARGEWEFNTEWKPLAGFPTYAGWARAIMDGQDRVQDGLRISCPVLIMHSARSLWPKAWDDAIAGADIVLDVAHMRRYGPGLGRDVTLVAIEGGMHDLTLSAPPVRERVFAELFAWLERL